MSKIIISNGIPKIITQKSANLKIGYWIPTENEWYKAAYYDPTLNSGSGGYWTYATRSNSAPTSVTANSIGDGSAGNTGNFANYNSGADWNGQNGNVTSVGTNGGPSYYGTFDQNGNVFEWNDLSIFVPNVAILRGGNWADGTQENLSFRYVGSTITGEGIGAGFRIVTNSNPLTLDNFVSVGNPDNNNDNLGYGLVNYTYMIGKYEVTNTEYVSFLNSVASTDTHNLYNPIMGTDARGGITRSGAAGSYSYSVKSNMGNKPVVFVSWFDCARYCNWLTNGRPTGDQDNTTTELGMYVLSGNTAVSDPNTYSYKYKIK